MKKNIIQIIVSTVIVLCLISIGLLIFGNKKPLEKELPIFDLKTEGIVSSTTTLFEQKIQEDGSILSDTTNKIKGTFIADDFSSGFSILKGQNVYDVMLSLSVSSIKSFTFKAKEYPGIGYFIEEINGIKNEGGKYWTLYVNGEYSTVGAYDYKPLDGDKIEWRYESL